MNVEVKFYPSKNNPSGGIIIIGKNKYPVWNNNGFLFKKEDDKWKLIAIKIGDKIKLLPRSIHIKNNNVKNYLEVDKIVIENIAKKLVAEELRKKGVKINGKEIGYYEIDKILRYRNDPIYIEDYLKELEKYNLNINKIFEMVEEIKHKLKNICMFIGTETKYYTYEPEEWEYETYNIVEYETYELKQPILISLLTILDCLGEFSEKELYEIAKMIIKTNPITLNTDFEIIKLKKPEPKIIEKKKIYTKGGEISYSEPPY